MGIAAALMKARAARRAGITLVELMVAMAIISIGVLGMVGAFKYFNVGLQSAKTRSLANNIAQEKIEYLKNKSYYRVLVSTDTDTDDRFSPAMEYDVAPNGEELVNVGGLNFIRRVLIRKVSEGAGGQLVYPNWESADTGLKEIRVYVLWYERGQWRKLEVRNLRENPARVNKSASIDGWVHEFGTGTGIEGALVRVQENPSQFAETDASGDYSFFVEPGSYTLIATKTGYFPKTLPQFGLTSGGTMPNQNFTLVPMSSGTITGRTWLRDHLVISQVVGSSVNAAGQSQEWVEVYNPTTWTWTMASGLGSGANELFHFGYKEAGVGTDAIVPDIEYRSVSLPPDSYFLFANTGTVTAAGVTLAADAVYDTDSDFGNADDLIQTGSPSSAGYVILGSEAASLILDTVGWDATSNGVGTKKLAESYEKDAIEQAIGFEPGEAYTRKTTSSGVTAGQGRCYDSNDNDEDFSGAKPFSSVPHNSSQSEACNSGTPAEGAIVFADDALSLPVTADDEGDFNLVSVATGSWTVYISSGLSFSSVAYYGGTVNAFVSSVGTLLLSSETAYGYVTGRVTNVAGAPLQGISVYSAGSPPTTTNSSGRYTLPISSGLATVIANYQSQSPSYVELSSASVDVPLGEVVKDVDFSLYYGGRIRGQITTNGVDPLPNIPVIGLKDGVEQGSGISDDTGHFTISGSGVSTGTYVVVPQLEAGEGCSPSSTTVILNAGEVAFSSTFTVANAFGYVTGSVHTGSLAGPLITTGVLVYVTTTTLAAGALPPDIDPSLRAGSSVWYAASSNALGNYSVSVKGGYTYNVYAWYTTWSNSVPSVSRKDSTAAVDPNETVTVNFFW